MCKILKTLVFAGFLLISSLQGYWSSPVDVGESSFNGGSGNPSVVMDSFGNTTAVWVGVGLVITTSTRPAGGEWSDITTLSEANCYLPLVVVDASGNLTVTWSTSSDSIQSSTKLYGGDWQLSPDTVFGPSSYYSVMAVDYAGNVTIACQLWSSGYVVQSSTKPVGSGWSSPVTVPSTFSQPVSCAIATDSLGNLTILLQDPTGSRALQSCTTLGGLWQAPEPVTSSSDPDEKWLVVDNDGNATVIWTSAPISIYASTRQHGGSWQGTPDTLVSSLNSGASLAIDSLGNVTAIWNLSSDNTLQSCTKLLNNSWQSPVNISPSGGTIADPSIGLDANGDAMVVWSRNTGSNTIIQASRRLFGGEWQSTPDDISVAGNNSYVPKVVVETADNSTALWIMDNGSEKFVQSSHIVQIPAVTGVSPHTGSAAGGDSVTITGEEFSDVTAVYFGTVPAIGFSIVSPTEIVAISPAGTDGDVYIRVETLAGLSPISDEARFTYSTTTVFPPSKFIGKIKNKKHGHHPYALKTKWNTSTSQNVSRYLIFKRSKVVGTVSASGKFCFKTHLKWKSSTKKFSIVAVNSNDLMSAHRKLKIRH